MVEDWRYWCRLCGSNEGEHINMFDTSFDVSPIIQKHLMISVRPNDETPTVVCINCLNFCLKLKKFADRSDLVDRMYNELLLNTLRHVEYDLDQVRSQYCTINDGNDSILEIELMSNTGSPTPSIKRENDVDLFNIDEFSNDDQQEVSFEHIEQELPVPKRKRGRPRKDEADAQAQASTSKYILLTTECNSSEYEEPNNSDSSSDFSEPSQSKKKKSVMTGRSRNVSKSFTCAFCCTTFESRLSLNRHKVTEHPDEKQLNRRKSSNRDRTFICEECGKTYCTKFQLTEHQLSHSNITPFQCTVCGKEFKSSQTLKIHLDTHNHTAYVCPHCGITLNTKRTLNMHLVVHSEERKFKCHICDKEYKRSKSLKAHLILHTGLRPYACPWCEKTFTNGSNFRKHKKLSHPAELQALEEAGEVLASTTLPNIKYLQPKLDEEYIEIYQTGRGEEEYYEDNSQEELQIEIIGPHSTV